MNQFLVTLIVAALIVATIAALAACSFRLLARKIRTPRPSLPRSLRLAFAVLVALIGLASAAPATHAASPIDPDGSAAPASTFSTVECQLNDIDPERVARILAAHLPAMLDQITVGCHKIPDDRLSKPCRFVSLPQTTPTLPACFPLAPAVELFIVDGLAFEQTEEWTEFSLAKVSGTKNQIDTIHIERNKPIELLVIALSEAGSYDYWLDTESYSDDSSCGSPYQPVSGKFYQPMSGKKTISVHDGSFFAVDWDWCGGDEVRLVDLTLEMN